MLAENIEQHCNIVMAALKVKGEAFVCSRTALHKFIVHFCDKCSTNSGEGEVVLLLCEGPQVRLSGDMR